MYEDLKNVTIKNKNTQRTYFHFHLKSNYVNNYNEQSLFSHTDIAEL